MLFLESGCYHQVNPLFLKPLNSLDEQFFCWFPVPGRRGMEFGGKGVICGTICCLAQLVGWSPEEFLVAPGIFTRNIHQCKVSLVWATGKPWLFQLFQLFHAGMEL